MRTKHHMIAALIDNGLTDEDATGLAELAFAQEDPRGWMRAFLAARDADIQRMTIEANAMRCVVDGTVLAPHLEATVR